MSKKKIYCPKCLKEVTEVSSRWTQSLTSMDHNVRNVYCKCGQHLTPTNILNIAQVRKIKLDGI